MCDLGFEHQTALRDTIMVPPVGGGGGGGGNNNGNIVPLNLL